MTRAMTSARVMLSRLNAFGAMLLLARFGCSGEGVTDNLVHSGRKDTPRDGHELTTTSTSSGSGSSKADTTLGSSSTATSGAIVEPGGEGDTPPTQETNDRASVAATAAASSASTGMIASTGGAGASDGAGGSDMGAATDGTTSDAPFGTGGIGSGAGGEGGAAGAPGEAPGWSFSRVTGIRALAAAAVANGHLYVLDGDDFVSGAGYHIRIYDTVESRQWLTENSSDGYGTSLAIDNHYGHVYTVALDNRVWRRPADHTSWFAFPQNDCDGNLMSPRQQTGDNNVSAHAGHVYVIGGDRVFYWTGTCWYRLPALPDGSPIELAQASHNPIHIWASNGTGEIYSWDGTWNKLAPELSLGMGYEVIIGFDGSSLWEWASSTESFERNMKWSFGSIAQVQRSFGFIPFTVVRPNGDLWWYGIQGA